MRVLTNIVFIVIVISLGTVSSCKKYLEAPSDKALVVIHSLKDMQSLLDNYSKLNYSDIGAGEESADDYFLTQSSWQSLDEYDRRKFTWSAEAVIAPYSFYGGNEWGQAYDRINIANTVLDHIDAAGIPDWDERQQADIKGQALLLRGRTFLQLASVWCLAFDSATAASELGIPLRLTSDFNIKSLRGTLAQTYDRITEDLRQAAALLPIMPLHVLRGSKAAAFGFLSRTYLAMRNYPAAGLYADSALQLSSELLDYNGIAVTEPFPQGIGQFNREVIFESKIPISGMLYEGRINSRLYESYDTNDLRRSIFFVRGDDNGKIFTGSYEQGYDLFSGIATDELYLTRAECQVRLGQLQNGMNDLNRLLEKRWKTGTFVPLETTDPLEALEMVLTERRKELLMRGLRWIDIRRLNKEGRAIVLTRTIGDETYTLAPNDLRYALAIPEDVISLADIRQNRRE